MSRIQDLTKRELITPPKWLPSNMAYETIMGSVAYGVSSDTSDMDIYGFCIPPKDQIFPHLNEEIPGFGTQLTRFEQYQQHHVIDKSHDAVRSVKCPNCSSGLVRHLSVPTWGAGWKTAAIVSTAPSTADWLCKTCNEAGNQCSFWNKDVIRETGRLYDFTIFSIVKFFDLCMDNNPNIIDSIFTPLSCVQHSTKVGNLVRSQRRLFLHKGCFHRFKGYAFSQLTKMQTKDPKGKRKEIRDQFGFDVKYAYHLIRLLDECEQILTTGDLDLQRNKEQLKAVRRGEWTEPQIREYFERREKELEVVYQESKLPWGPDEPAIKELLLNCLEEHYGSLKDIITIPHQHAKALADIQGVLDRIRV